MFHVGGGARVYRSDGCGAVLRLDDFGKVTLITGASEIGQGSETVLAMLVAEELGVPLERVTVVNSDTAVKPWDVGVHASRTTFIAGNAALLAARQLKEKVLAIGSQVLGARMEALAMGDGLVFVRSAPERCLPYDKVVRAGHFRQGGQTLAAEAFYDPPSEMLDKDFRGNVSVTYGFAAQAALVEVDEASGQIAVLKVASAHDVGRVLNPQFLDYKLLTARDMPEVVVIPIETLDAAGPFGAKGVGEAGTIPIAAAVANAVHDAVGVRLTALPLTPERVYRALQARRACEGASGCMPLQPHLA
jgi:xanthine dehydrogenase molybdenum-binding subunit